MPGQIKRLLIIFVLIMTVFFIARKIFVPESFGKYGHFRADAINEIMAQEVKYAGHRVCNDCHDEIDAAKKKSFHKKVSCEACHGPTADHVKSFDEDEVILPFAPRKRGYCTLCHIYDPAKPTGFPQIDPVAHNPIKPCITCHDPHSPEPPEMLNGCSACHAGISRTKALSPHSLLECTQCHITPDEHRINPRANRPGLPVDREDCGICHGKKAESDKLIPRVDMIEHGDGYLCWQCHYPHYPESK